MTSPIIDPIAPKFSSKDFFLSQLVDVSRALLPGCVGRSVWRVRQIISISVIITTPAPILASINDDTGAQVRLPRLKPRKSKLWWPAALSPGITILIIIILVIIVITRPMPMPSIHPCTIATNLIFQQPNGMQAAGDSLVDLCKWDLSKALLSNDTVS